VEPNSVNAEFIKKIIYYISKADKENPNFEKYTAAGYDLYKAQLKAMKFEGLPYEGDEDVVSRAEMNALKETVVDVFTQDERKGDPKNQDKFVKEYDKLVDQFFPEKKANDKSGASLGINYDGVLKSQKKMKSLFPNHKIFTNPSFMKLIQAAEERYNAIKLISGKLLPRAKELKNNADRESFLTLLYEYYHDKQAILDMALFYEDTGNLSRAKDFYAELSNQYPPGEADYIKVYYKYTECAWKSEDKKAAKKGATYLSDFKKQLTPEQQKLIDTIKGDK
jgi:hypothetical protein